VQWTDATVVGRRRPRGMAMSIWFGITPTAAEERTRKTDGFPGRTCRNFVQIPVNFERAVSAS
jgi:hypothetical protein